MSITQKLVEAGYVEHRHSTYQIFKATHILYQKRISDEKGVRYFINCWIYEKDDVTFKEDTPSFEVQFKTNDGTTCNVEPFYQDIDSAEAFFRQIWERMNFGYYELYH